MTLADDSGLEVDLLQGNPGVYSARYAGPNATDAENNKKLLAELEEFKDENLCQVSIGYSPHRPSGWFEKISFMAAGRVESYTSQEAKMGLDTTAFFI